MMNALDLIKPGVRGLDQYVVKGKPASPSLIKLSVRATMLIWSPSGRTMKELGTRLQKKAAAGSGPSGASRIRGCIAGPPTSISRAFPSDHSPPCSKLASRDCRVCVRPPIARRHSAAIVCPWTNFRSQKMSRITSELLSRWRMIRLREGKKDSRFRKPSKRSIVGRTGWQTLKC